MPRHMTCFDNVMGSDRRDGDPCVPRVISCAVRPGYVIVVCHVDLSSRDTREDVDQ